MRVAPFSRALTLILALAAIFLSGCRSQSPRFYTLSPIQEDQGISKRKTPAQNAVIGIGPFSDLGNMAIFRRRADAEAFVKEDPFVLEGLVKSVTIRDWDDSVIPE